MVLIEKLGFDHSMMQYLDTPGNEPKIILNRMNTIAYPDDFSTFDALSFNPLNDEIILPSTDDSIA